MEPGALTEAIEAPAGYRFATPADRRFKRVDAYACPYCTEVFLVFAEAQPHPPKCPRREQVRSANPYTPQWPIALVREGS